MTSPTIAVTAATPNQVGAAESLANRLGCPFISSINQKETDEAGQSFDYLLIATPDYLGLLSPKQPEHAIFYIDFLKKSYRYRLQTATLKKERLARALGVKPTDQGTLIDATAGLGRDGFMLAKLGFELILLERSPIIHCLLQDALNRAMAHPLTAPIAARMQLIHADANTWLTEAPRPSIIYLDPMFPARQKSASVKKEMALLQNLLGHECDSLALLKVALTCATDRVVIKRPRLAAQFDDLCPTYSLPGKTSRFDIFLTKR